MKVRPWKIGLVGSLIAVGAVSIQVTNPAAEPRMAWMFLGVIPLVLFTIRAFILDKTKGPGWEDSLQTKHDQEVPQGGLFGAQSPLAPLRGHPLMLPVGIFGIAAAMGLFALGNRAQMPIYWMAGILFMVTGGYSLGLAGMSKAPRYDEDLVTQTAPASTWNQPPKNERSTRNPLGASTYGTRQKRRTPLAAAVAGLAILVLAVAGIALYEMDIISGNPFEAADLRGSSTTGIIRWEAVGDDMDTFVLTGTPDQEGTSKTFAIPVLASQFNVTLRWNQLLTDTADEAYIIEERVDGEWFVVAAGTANGLVEATFAQTGDAWRATLKARGAQEREVVAQAEYGRFMETKCTAKAGDEPTCSTTERDKSPP